MVIEFAKVQPGRVYHLRHQFNASDAARLVLGCAAQGDPAAQGDDQHLLRIGMQKQGQMAQEAENLQRAVVGRHLPAPIERHFAETIGLLFDGDDALGSLLVKYQFPVDGRWLGNAPQHIRGY